MIKLNKKVSRNAGELNGIGDSLVFHVFHHHLTTVKSAIRSNMSFAARAGVFLIHTAIHTARNQATPGPTSFKQN